ncbi:hypothetical protein Lfu02_80430 [Longispora fulva]|uniref:Uncharacterized protein n=1 Tax=Longispora fulva TaxID=619741 RepID=A0A8J7GKB6_9ACTN|nr:hypothetical protein [Longispora fulva]MBG6140668.1 hypothetical protein [Longispora fulva]MBG6141114.1 hypothetical protein [Longispora fulva]GIG63671.1 hypothetical protein Lfu02_80430 [Longispora fulva]
MSDHMITTQVLPGPCRRCRSLVLTGVAEGVPVNADAQPLDRDGVFAALLGGRSTYVLQRGELVRLDATRAGLTGPVVADHRCGEPLPAPPPAPPPRAAPPAAVPYISRNANRVREHLLAHGPDLTTGVAVRLGLSVETAENLLRRLVAAGQAERIAGVIPAPWRAVAAELIPPY